VPKRVIDPHATKIPKQSGLLPCLYIPIAARDIVAIEKHVGKITAHLSKSSSDQALLVESYEPEEPDLRLPIWDLPAASVLHCRNQVWVHVDYSAYRRAYIRAFPDALLTGHVLDHVLNRRSARIKGFNYLRIVPVSRAVNSSHGGLSECWGVEHHSSPQMLKSFRESKALVEYADLCDIVKMLNMQGGGSFMEIVNDAQRLVDLPKTF
jgi:hypothetical protein